MFIPGGSDRWWVTMLIVATVACGCAASAPPRKAESPFRAEHTAALRAGMNPREVIALFGQPTSVFSRQFGESVGDPWLGVVYEYVGNTDARFRYEPRECRHRLVFALVDGDSLLNHWSLDPCPQTVEGTGGRGFVTSTGTINR